jgi:hypothetical protein
MTDISIDQAIAEKNFKDHFGACPHCRQFDGIMNVGKGHWLFCDEHKVRWFVGSNLFDSWKQETEEEQRAIYDAKDFGSYQDVSPYHPPSTDVRREDTTKLERLFSADNGESHCKPTTNQERHQTMNDPLVTIETSCGQVFELRVSELSDRQLTILLAGNGERADVDPAHIAAMRAELQRRATPAQNEHAMTSTNTFRNLAESQLINTIYQSIGGSPWTDEFEDALANFMAKFNSAIDAVPVVAEVFDKRLTRDASIDDGRMPAANLLDSGRAASDTH